MRRKFDVIKQGPIDLIFCNKIQYLSYYNHIYLETVEILSSGYSTVSTFSNQACSKEKIVYHKMRIR